MSRSSTKESGHYRVLRDFGGHVAGDVIDLPADEAAQLVRDGMVAPKEEG